MSLFSLSRRDTRRLLAGLLALAGLAARAQCPTMLIERFIPADCEACWREVSAPAAGSLVLDWIVPSPRGEAAPLSAAALPEATPRATGLKPDAALVRQHALQARGLDVEVEDGPAWNGYMGLVLRVRRGAEPLPDGAAGYLALVETVPAGDEGTPIARRVMRVFAGPLTLDPSRATVEHLLALRLPMGARGDRLGAVGWVESKAGQVIALARARGGDCNAAE